VCLSILEFVEQIELANNNWWWCVIARLEGVGRNRYFLWRFCVITVPSRCRSTNQILVRGSPYLFSNFGAVRGFYPPTKFSQIAFGTGILSKIGEGRTKQNAGFEC